MGLMGQSPEHPCPASQAEMAVSPDMSMTPWPPMAGLEYMDVIHSVVSPADLCFMAAAVSATAVTSSSNQPQAQLPVGSGHGIALGISTGIPSYPGLAQEVKAASTKRAASSTLPQCSLLAAKTSRGRETCGGYSQP